MTATIRDATHEDAAAIAAIYSTVILESPASFELEPVTAEEMARRIDAAQRKHFWLVAEEEGAVLGYAYAGPFRDRAAYDRTCEASVYLGKGNEGRGLGRLLTEELLRRVREMGFAIVIAGITLPNPASVALFESFGFRQVGVFERVGFKFDRWHDVGFWQLDL